MILQDWYKDGKIYEFDMFKKAFREENWEHHDKVLLAEGYLPVYDRRKLSYPNRERKGTVILENDPVCADYLIDIQNDICVMRHRIKDVNDKMTNLHPEHIPILKKYYDEKLVRNILIDSLFQDIDQFRYMIIKCFSYFVDVNFFINSHGTLFKILNEEIKSNMDKYPIRNSYYTHQNGKAWFNELAFTLIKNNIYEIDVVDDKIEYLTKIKFQNGYNKSEAVLGQKQKYMYKGYKVDVFEEEEKNKSKWEI